MNHTPTPYRIAKHDSLENVYHIDAGPQGYERITVAILSGKQSKENARHIVHCVNSHEALVEALRELVEEIGICHEYGSLTDKHYIMGDPLTHAKNILAQAEKGV